MSDNFPVPSKDGRAFQLVVEMSMISWKAKLISKTVPIVEELSFVATVLL